MLRPFQVREAFTGKLALHVQAASPAGYEAEAFDQETCAWVLLSSDDASAARAGG